MFNNSREWTNISGNDRKQKRTGKIYKLRRANQRILEKMYPKRCPFCQGISSKGICDDCRKQVVKVGEIKCIHCGKPLEDETKEYCRDCERRIMNKDAASGFTFRRFQIQYIGWNITTSDIMRKSLGKSWQMSLNFRFEDGGSRQLFQFHYIDRKWENEDIIRQNF